MRFVVVYQREPHARQMAFRDVAQPKTTAERCSLARDTLTELSLDVDVWVDDLGDSSRALFGDLPNWAVVVGADGTVRAKWTWFEPQALGRVLQELRQERPASAAPLAEQGFATAAATPAPGPDAPFAERHHRRSMLAWLVEHEPGHHDRDAWLDELSANGPPQQRAWAAAQPPTIPPGEDPRQWAEEIRRLAADRTAAPSARPVVFVGSSSIRLWTTLPQDMAGIDVLQRGFGGSRLFDACYWSEQLVTRHHPAAVVLFSGTNDIAGDQPKSAEQVRDLFRLFVQRARRTDPTLPIAFIAITPTPAREQHLGIVREANRLVRAVCESDPRLEFVDPTPDLAAADGAPDPRWFLDDGLHLATDGYAVWTRHIRPAIERLLAGGR